MNEKFSVAVLRGNSDFALGELKPNKSEFWVHKKTARIYEILLLANTKSGKPDFKPTVVYKCTTTGENYARDLDTFSKKFHYLGVFVGQAVEAKLNVLGQAILRNQIHNLAEGWEKRFTTNFDLIYNLDNVQLTLSVNQGVAFVKASFRSSLTDNFKDIGTSQNIGLVFETANKVVSGLIKIEDVIKQQEEL